MYGLEPVETIVGVATRTSSSHPSDRLNEALVKNQAFMQRLQSAGAAVLEGNLVQRSGEFEEKQVDVLCALAVADAADRIAQNKTRARCIVVLSEDMDLMPAIEFATNRGVPTYAAAYDTIHQRPQQRDWMILHEAALKEICDPPGRHHGSALRRRLASIVTTPQSQALTWRVIAARMNDGRALLTSNFGATALWKPTRQLQHGEKLPLYVAGVEMDPHTSRFPYLNLSDAAPTAATCPGIELADVLYWTAPTMVKVQMRGQPGAQAALRATPGSLLPGQEVAVLKVSRSGNRARYLVGALTDVPVPSGWTAPARTAIAVAQETVPTGKAWFRSKLEVSGDEILVKAHRNDHLPAGGRLVVALSGESNGRVPQAMPLSCCIP
jgi:hypothetical protein